MCTRRRRQSSGNLELLCTHTHSPKRAWIIYRFTRPPSTSSSCAMQLKHVMMLISLTVRGYGHQSNATAAHFVLLVSHVWRNYVMEKVEMKKPESIKFNNHATWKRFDRCSEGCPPCSHSQQYPCGIELHWVNVTSFIALTFWRDLNLELTHLTVRCTIVYIFGATLLIHSK